MSGEGRGGEGDRIRECSWPAATTMVSATLDPQLAWPTFLPEEEKKAVRRDYMVYWL